VASCCLAAARASAADASDVEADFDLFYLSVNVERYDEAIEYGRAYLAAHPENDAFAIDLADAELSAKKLDDARDILIKRLAYVAEHPASAGLFFDLARAYLAADRIGDARALVVTQRAYLEGHKDAAQIWLDVSLKDAAAANWRDAYDDLGAYLRYFPGDDNARQARAAYLSAEWNGPRLQSYGYGLYEGRFSDGFFGADTQYVLARGVVQPYLANHIVADVRTGAPGSPQTFSDNAVIFSTGLRAKLNPYAFLFAEGGAAVGTRGNGTVTDLRYGLYYSQRWGSQAYTEVDVNAATYTRYGNNFITYTSAYTMWGGFLGSKLIRPIVGVNVGLDEKSVYGNNFAESFGGIQIGNDALSVRLVDAAGLYIQRSGPAQRPYSTFRALIVFGVSQ
jgi:tetratricopeptide (TPR) repeat protein